MYKYTSRYSRSISRYVRSFASYEKKPLLVSGIRIDGTRYNNTYVAFYKDGDNYVGELYEKKITISNNDVVEINDKALRLSLPAGTYTFKDTITGDQSFSISMTFKSNSETYENIVFNIGYVLYVAQDLQNYVEAYAPSKGWAKPAYKTIQLSTTKTLTQDQAQFFSDNLINF